MTVSGIGAVRWIKSTRSAGNGACVEISFLADQVGVRDSKDSGGQPIFVGSGSWLAFVDGVRRGEFDHH